MLGVVLRYRPAWVIGIGAFGGTFGWASFGTFWPIFMLEDHNVPLTQTGWLFGLVSLTTIPPALAVGLYAPRIRNWRVVVTVAGLVMTGGLFGMLVTTDVWLLALFATAVGLGWGYMPIALTVPFEMPRAGAKALAASSSFIMTLILGGSILGPVVVGVVSDLSGSRFTALVVSAVAPIAVTASGLAPRPPRRGPTRLGVGAWAFVDVVPTDARPEVHQRNRRHDHRKQTH